MKFIIYLITNKINNKKYVGQTTVGINKRWQRHCWQCTLKANRQAITEAINKYGKENFIIFEIDYADSLEDSNRKEVFWGLFYNTLSPNGYNLKLGGRKYSEVSEETKKKISQSNKGKKASAQTIQKLSDSHKGFKVKDETKLKLSDRFKGKKPHKNTNKGASNKNCKKYLLLSPNNQEIEVINMKIFCIENNLQRSNMSALVQGKIKEYKGWKFIKDLGFMRDELGSRRNPIS